MPLPLFAVALAEDRLDRSALVRATLAAEIHDPHSAVAVGYLDRVVPVDEVEGAAIAEARRLGAYSSRAYAQTKEVLRGPTVQRVLSGAEADLARFTVEPPA
jgi:enoyl-CoA hydratase/carnithine racemase